MKISYDGIGHLDVTFPAKDCAEGQVCKLDGNGQAAACGAGDMFCGKAGSVKNGMAAVQIEGFVTVGYTGTAPVCGYAGLSADGNGGVKADSAGKTYLVAAVDTGAMTAVIKL